MNDEPNPANAAQDLRTAATGSQEPLPNTVSPISPAPATEEPVSGLEEAMAARATAVQQHGTGASTPTAAAGPDFMNTPEMQELRLRAAATQGEIEDYIRQNPTHAVLYAAAAGFVLGFILRK